MKFFIIGIAMAGVIGGVYYFFVRDKYFPAVQNEPIAHTTQPMDNELKIEDIKVGEGTETKTGNTVSVNYIGTLLNGTKFDSSYDAGKPFEFTLGQNKVIQGWEKGILGMKTGGKRKLTIPPSLGYGETGAGGIIPSNATLLFEIELLDVK